MDAKTSFEIGLTAGCVRCLRESTILRIGVHVSEVLGCLKPIQCRRNLSEFKFVAFVGSDCFHMHEVFPCLLPLGEDCFVLLRQFLFRVKVLSGVVASLISLKELVFVWLYFEFETVFAWSSPLQAFHLQLFL